MKRKYNLKHAYKMTIVGSNNADKTKLSYVKRITLEEAGKIIAFVNVPNGKQGGKK